MKKIIYMLLLIQSGFIMAQTKTVVTPFGEKVTINPYVNNGLSTDNGYIQLGGPLTRESVLTTTSAFTLAIKGLGTGSLTDDVIVTDPITGVLKKINAASLAGAGSFWSLLGNAGTDPTLNFLGTTDDKPLMFRIDGNNAGAITKKYTAFGYNAYNTTATGGGNTAIGVNALSSSTTTWSSTAVGSDALKSNTSGGSNTAVGSSALSLNTTGQSNTGIGSLALQNNTEGLNNTSVGAASLSRNSTGSYNTGLGNGAMVANTTGDSNTGIGNFSIYNNTTGKQNTAVGDNSLRINTLGSNNTSLGFESGRNISGSNNITLGSGVLGRTSTSDNVPYTGNQNIAIGDNLSLSSRSASNEMNIGNALFGTAVNGTIGTANIGVNVQAPSNALHVKPVGANDPLKVEGLKPAVGGENVIVAGTDGVFKTVSASSLAGTPIEPWQIEGTTDKATANTDNIYQMGNVGIGTNDMVNGAILDVRGAVRTGAPLVGAVVGTNSLAIGVNNTASGANSFAMGAYGTASGANSIAIGAANATYPTIASGINSFALGMNTLASGTSSVAIGGGSTASAANSFAIGGGKASGTNTFAMGPSSEAKQNAAMAVGNSVVADGSFAFAGGDGTLAKNWAAFAIGGATQALGNSSFTAGAGTIVKGVGAAGFGRYNAITLDTYTSVLGGMWTDPVFAKDALFQIGNGVNPISGTVRNNALTILNNGYTGIGIIGTEAAAKPTEMFDVGSGNVRVRAINSSTGSVATDKVVVADTNGILKTVDASSLSGTTNAWNLLGNSGTDSANNFVGTKDNQPLRFRIQDTNAGTLSQSNTAFGYKAFNTTSTGASNTAIGDQALNKNTSGAQNVAVGTSALQNNTIGSFNNAVGYNALNSNTGSSHNNAFGTSALQNFSGSIGSNSAFGSNTLKALVTGDSNSAFGFNALTAATSSSNSAFGHSALLSATSGGNNTAIGYGTFQILTTGSNNTAVGYQAGHKLSGSNNIAIGYNTAFATANSGDKNILIGNAVNLSNATVANELNIGNALFGTNVNSTIGTAKIGVNTQAPSTALHVKPAAVGADPLTVEGLNTGSATDKFVVADANGVFKTVDRGSAGTSMRIRRVVDTSTTLADATDDVLIVNAATADVTVTIPAGLAAGRVFTIKRVDTSSKTVKIVFAAGGATIDETDTSITVGSKVSYQIITEGSDKWQTISRV